MKRTAFVVVVLALVAGLVATSCASGPADRPGGGIPGPIQQARRTTMAMEGNMIVGIGTANMATLSQSRTTAANRAAMDLIRQLGLMVDYIAVDLQAGAEVDHSAALAHQREIQLTLARQTIRNATIVDEYEAANGQYWVIMSLSRAQALNEIADANQSAARLAPGAAAAEWSLEQMSGFLDSAMQRTNNHPVTFTGD